MTLPYNENKSCIFAVERRWKQSAQHAYNNFPGFLVSVPTGNKLCQFGKMTNELPMAGNLKVKRLMADKSQGEL